MEGYSEQRTRKRPRTVRAPFRSSSRRRPRPRQPAPGVGVWMETRLEPLVVPKLALCLCLCLCSAQWARPRAQREAVEEADTVPCAGRTFNFALYGLRPPPGDLGGRSRNQVEGRGGVGGVGRGGTTRRGSPLPILRLRGTPRRIRGMWGAWSRCGNGPAAPQMRRNGCGTLCRWMYALRAFVGGG